MANDRVYLRCKVCRKVVMIAKYYPGGRLKPYVPDWVPARLDAFLEHHLLECLGYPGVLPPDAGLIVENEESVQPEDHWINPKEKADE